MSNDTTTTPDASTVTTDPRPLFDRAAALAGRVVGGVTADQTDLETPCDGMDVDTLRRHLFMVLDRVELLGRGDDAFADDELPPLPADVPGEWTSRAEAAVSAWSDDRLADTVVLPWATQSGADCLSLYVAELTAHSWDLARATGQNVVWDDEVTEHALVTMRAQLPMADRTPMWEAFAPELPEGVAFEPPFANAVPVADDASAIDRFVGWIGRTP